MIFESYPWKRQLLRDASNLKRIAKTPVNDENDDALLARLERLIFVSAYSMRKLHESGKLSTGWIKIKLRCLRFAFIGKDAPTALNSHKIEKFYELTNPRDVNLLSEEFCDRVIHSFVFSPVMNEENLVVGFLLTSDRLRKQCLWFVPLSDVISLMIQTGKDYPNYGVWIRNESAEPRTWAGNGKPPAGWLASIRKFGRQ